MVTDEELKALVAENSLAIREMRAERAESVRKWEESRLDSERQRQESERWWQESRQETERLWLEIRASRQESERLWQESRQEAERQRQESERLWLEIRASREDFDRQMTSFNRQLGQIGNRLGDYTESLFRPSLERALREQFGMTVVTAPQRIRYYDEAFEFDMVGHAGDEIDEVYLVEIKSRLREDGIDQLLDQLRQFPRLFPEHRGKKLYGILAALDAPEPLRAKALKEGFYLATIKDDVFEIVPPGDGFEPRAFGLRGLSR